MSEPIYKSYDAASVEYIRAMVATVLEGLGTTLGIQFNVSTTTYTTGNFDLSVSHSLGLQQTTPSSALNTSIVQSVRKNDTIEHAINLMNQTEHSSWNAICAVYGFNSIHYGAVVQSNKGPLMLYAFKRANRKYPVIGRLVRKATNGDYVVVPGSGIKMPESYAKSLLGIQ